MMQPKWFRSVRDLKKGDVVLFLKSDKEFYKQYQFGMISDIKISRDLKIRQVEIEYQNCSEKIKGRTTRGTREIQSTPAISNIALDRTFCPVPSAFTVWCLIKTPAISNPDISNYISNNSIGP